MAVVVTLALALALPPSENLKNLVDKIFRERAMPSDRFTNWGINMTTVSERGKEKSDGRN